MLFNWCTRSLLPAGVSFIGYWMGWCQSASGSVAGITWFSQGSLFHMIHYFSDFVSKTCIQEPSNSCWLKSGYVKRDKLIVLVALQSHPWQIYRVGFWWCDQNPVTTVSKFSTLQIPFLAIDISEDVEGNVHPGQNKNCVLGSRRTLNFHPLNPQPTWQTRPGGNFNVSALAGPIQ